MSGPTSEVTADLRNHPAIREARRVIEVEAAAIAGLLDNLGQEFIDAVELIRNGAGRVVSMGMGKSGIICRKI